MDVRGNDPQCRSPHPRLLSPEWTTARAYSAGAARWRTSAAPTPRLFHRVRRHLGAALAYLLAATAEAWAEAASPSDLKPRPPHFPAKAKSVIHLFMNGGPSQMDLFDPKPMLDKHHGKPYFDKIAGEVEFIKDAGALMRSPFKFARHGQCGAWVSEAMPHLAGMVDDLAFIRSMYTTNLTHEPAIYLIQSGKMGPGRPALGLVGGLWPRHARTRTCRPTSCSTTRSGLPVNGVENWQAGFLPPVFQGTRFRSTGSPVLNLRPDVDRPPDVDEAERDLLARLDQIHRRDRPGSPTLDARIASYELAGEHAAGRDRRPGPLQRELGDPGNVRHRPGADRLLRPPLPDRPPAGRARRPLRAAVHQRPDLGQPHEPGDRPQDRLRPHRPADRGAADAT